MSSSSSTLATDSDVAIVTVPRRGSDSEILRSALPADGQTRTHPFRNVDELLALRDEFPPAGQGAVGSVPEIASYSVQAIESPDDLRAIRPAWNDLVAHASVDNPFYAPHQLLPAIEHLFANRRVIVFAIWGELADGTDDATDGTPQRILCGLFPCEYLRRWGRLPISRLRLLSHDFCFVTSPLLRVGVKAETLRTFFGWLKQQRDLPQIVECTHWVAEGALHHALPEVFEDFHHHVAVVKRFSRPVLDRPNDLDDYLVRTLSASFRKKLRQGRRRLLKLEAPELRHPGSVTECVRWIEMFLELERESWKGREGTAAVQSAASAAFIRTAWKAAFEAGRLQMLGLFDGETPLAIVSNLLGERELYAVKTAFDESHSRISPGTQLELESIRVMHAGSSLQLMDSCISGSNELFDRLCPHRRAFEQVLFSTGRWREHMLLNLMGVKRVAKHAARRVKNLSPLGSRN